jgi:hypothetical protein
MFPARPTTSRNDLRRGWLLRVTHWFLLLSCACSTAGQPENSAQTRKICVVAKIGNDTVRTEHVDAIRASIQPTPSWARAARLTIDAALAHTARGGSLSADAPHVWLASFRLLHEEAAQVAGQQRPIDIVLKRLVAAQHEYGYVRGECGDTEEQS